MTDIEPAIRKALRPRIGNVERRTRYLLDAHAVAVAAAVARERKQADDAQRVMADDINRIAAERDEARETAAGLATAWDRERETLAAHIGALEGERDKAEKLAEALRLARRNDIRAHDAEMAEARQRVDDVRIAIVDITAENARLREQLAAREDEITVTRRAKRDAMLATVAGYEVDGQIYPPSAVRIITHDAPNVASREEAPAPAAQAPAPAARSAPRARRAARVGPGKGTAAQEAQEAPVAAEGGSDGEGSGE